MEGKEKYWFIKINMGFNWLNAKRKSAKVIEPQNNPHPNLKNFLHRWRTSIY